MSKNKILPSVTLGSICLIVALLLALVNTVTGPKIEANNNEKANSALTAVLPGHTGFTDVKIPENFPKSINLIKKSAEGGYVFRSVVTGKSSGMTVMIGIDKDGAIAGTECTSSNETPGYKEKVFDLTDKGEDGYYYGMTKDTVEYLNVSKATLTSEAYAKAVKDAFDAFTILGGGSVDLRTEEEILNDNLNAALGTEDKTFTKWFAYEVTGAEAIYEEDNGDGTVVLLGETFVGIRGTEAVTEGIDAKTLELALSAFNIYKTAKENAPSEITLPEGVHSNVLKAYKTAQGSYIFEVRAAGYGILGGSEWHPASGEYIYIKLAVTADGVIISTLTTSEEETDGIGDACAKPGYYEQYNGKTSETYGDVPQISGATITSDGYKNAIKQAFAALELIKGGDSND